MTLILSQQDVRDCLPKLAMPLLVMHRTDDRVVPVATARWLAATLRFRQVVDQYQTTSHAPEALYRLVESYLSLGIPTEAMKAGAVLGHNYPDSKWYERAHKLLVKNPS